eukprot:scaffold32861_cov52-Phaeocystis_antarctica.AAC.1
MPAPGRSSGEQSPSLRSSQQPWRRPGPELVKLQSFDRQIGSARRGAQSSGRPPPPPPFQSPPSSPSSDRGTRPPLPPPLLPGRNLRMARPVCLARPTVEPPPPALAAPRAARVAATLHRPRAGSLAERVPPSLAVRGGRCWRGRCCRPARRWGVVRAQQWDGVRERRWASARARWYQGGARARRRCSPARRGGARARWGGPEDRLAWEIVDLLAWEISRPGRSRLGGSPASEDLPPGEIVEILQIPGEIALLVERLLQVVVSIILVGRARLRRRLCGRRRRRRQRRSRSSGHQIHRRAVTGGATAKEGRWRWRRRRGLATGDSPRWRVRGLARISASLRPPAVHAGPGPLRAATAL